MNVLQRLFGLFTPDDWQRSVALVILWAYTYNLVLWPALFWATTLITLYSGVQIPAPPLVPWEHLFTGTTTLGLIGGIATWRENNRMKNAPRSDQNSGQSGTVVNS